MKIFLSWAGEDGRVLANVLRDWLPNVVLGIEPWLASADLSAGDDWQESVAREIDSADAAILCVTRASLMSDWFMYEAGALIARLNPGRVLPVLLNIPSRDLSGPLATIQAIDLASKPEALLRALEQISGGSIPPNAVPGLVEDLQIRLKINDLSTSARKGSEFGADLSASEGEVRTSRPGELERKIDALAVTVATLADLVGTRAQQANVPSNANRALSDAKPTLFIGSSVEGKKIAEAIQVNLDRDVECTLWTQDVFAPSSGTFETLVDKASDFDFAVIVMTPDDTLEKRGESLRVPRDNLLFEMGLFTGRLGRARAFVVFPRDEDIHFPSDFDGVTKIDFGMKRQDSNLIAAVGTAATRIKQAMGV